MTTTNLRLRHTNRRLARPSRREAGLEKNRSTLVQDGVAGVARRALRGVAGGERRPPRHEDDTSWVEVRERLRDCPDRARSLLTVRAAISSARGSLVPRSRSLSLMCSY
jgi:hypothetical protein